MRWKARWCLATGFSPSEYDELTVRESEIFIEELIARQKEEEKNLNKLKRKRRS